MAHYEVVLHPDSPRTVPIELYPAIAMALLPIWQRHWQRVAAGGSGDGAPDAASDAMPALLPERVVETREDVAV